MRRVDSARALEILNTEPCVMIEGAGTIEGMTTSDEEIMKAALIQEVIFPWKTTYKIWWGMTVFGAILTAFFIPFMIAFHNESSGKFNTTVDMIEMYLNLIFLLDIVVNFKLAFYRNGVIIYDRREIFKQYVRCMFWVDLIGVFPFELVASFFASDVGEETVLQISLLRMFRFVRLHRMKKLSYTLQYNTRLSFLWFTMLRNVFAVLIQSHLAACCMYFLARLHNFGEDTWLGPRLESDEEMNEFDRYIISLYWAVVTFCTVGYGDFSPMNSNEQICGIVFMIANIVVAAWIIGSITLLVVKGDEKTGEYRDTLQILQQYSTMHRFDDQFSSTLNKQLRLGFNNREVADEKILNNFPSSVRRKILRKLYLDKLVKTKLMGGIRQQFVDAFLASCTVEIFSPGEVIVERGSILSDLFLLVGGIAEFNSNSNLEMKAVEHTECDDNHTINIEAGEFIGEIGFFTESLQVDSVVCLTVCKTLTMSRSSYKLLAQDHPGSAGNILRNLLSKVKEHKVLLPKKLSILCVGSEFDAEEGYGSLLDSSKNDHYKESARQLESMTAIRDLVEMHISKQLDDQTTHFCFAASRGDTTTISIMCSNGFDPNNSDYDSRTALMVASMKGNTDICKLLLKYKANPNLTDMHGSTALLEAVKNSHEETMKVLFFYGAQLCLDQNRSASILCQAVFDGDILLLKRLLRAGIQVNASDYDKRTAAHIAAAEGNVAAIRVLEQHGADLTLEDRWNNTVKDEVERSKSQQVMEYLQQSSSQ